MSDVDLQYLRECLQTAPFTPYTWEGEDRNIAAFRSREELIAWYCQPPGVVAQPYRDRGFYTRELAMLSRIVQPRVVVEFGTCQGIGTYLLRCLNPTARLVTVDVNMLTYIPGNQRVLVGHLARWQGVDCQYICGYSWDYVGPPGGVSLCFIDADHSYDAVKKDSERAWLNKPYNGMMANPVPWAIAWHDHNDRHPGVVKAVAEFCDSHDVALQSRPDSDTVWIMGGV